MYIFCFSSLYRTSCSRITLRCSSCFISRISLYAKQTLNHLINKQEINIISLITTTLRILWYYIRYHTNQQIITTRLRHSTPLPKPTVYALKSTAPPSTMAFIIINSHPQSYCLFCLSLFCFYSLFSCAFAIRLLSRKVVNKTVLATATVLNV